MANAFWSDVFSNVTKSALDIGTAVAKSKIIDQPTNTVTYVQPQPLTGTIPTTAVQTASAASMPSWLMPVLVGGGVLLVVMLLMKKGK